MSESKKVRINLTPEQKAELTKVTGKEADALEFTPEELEERIAPFRAGPSLGA